MNGILITGETYRLRDDFYQRGWPKNSIQFSPALGIKYLNTLDFDLVYLVFYQFLIKQRYMTNKMFHLNLLPTISFSPKKAWPHLMKI